MTSDKSFDAIVVGGGHAGIEAVRVLSARGHRVALVTLDKNKIGAMSCNPAIGGVAKSHLVFEVDSLGGLMGAAADRSAIQSRRLNLKKGPAVRSTRVQCDKLRYASHMVRTVSTLPGVTIIESELLGFDYEKNKISKVTLADGSEIRARSVIITAGTFMQAIMFCGEQRSVGGRFGDQAARGLSASIAKTGHTLKRLKTGTPARLESTSIDFSKLERQWGDPEQRRFSWQDTDIRLPQISCFMTYTNARTHDVIRANFHRAPLFSGEIVGEGPRYCPSIEDKVRRFAERERHQIFLEPEGLDLKSIYPNGMSTSLPADAQLDFLRTIEGLEKVELARPGYAVEYDSMNPLELRSSLMSSFVDGLFFAGQVNRTSGYEEAAAQGLWAGISASRYLKDEEALTPDRSRSYMETLVDDLVTKGTDEPYRMFTSRSEYRLILREDNAFDRMRELGESLGLVSEQQRRHFDLLNSDVERLKSELLSRRHRLSADKLISLFEMLKRTDVQWESLALHFDNDGTLRDASDRAIEKIEIDAKYSGYLKRVEGELNELRRARSWGLSPHIDLGSIAALSTEDREKIRAANPKNILELSRISGVTPNAVLAVIRSPGAICNRSEVVPRETI
jgi:tRNA uridine 5-carboxymethylaminomethyl modification enzyme